MYCKSEKLRLEIHKKALSFRKRRKITLCVILGCIKTAMEGEIYSLFHFCWLPKWITAIKGRAGMLSAAHPPNAVCISLPLKPQQKKNIPKMITKYWTVERTGSSLHQSKQCSLSICKYFRAEIIICAKPNVHVQEQLQVSRSQNVKMNELALFYYLLCLFVQESQTINSQRLPTLHSLILWQWDVSMVPLQGSCC